MRTGIAQFTLDYGKCPKWLFDRMVRLGGLMTEVIIAEYGPQEFIKRLADPVWFQALGTVLAFDWNASGLTTILTAALKEAIRGREERLNLFICGGKGKTSRKTPEQIQEWGSKIGLRQAETNVLVYNSRMSAKVDSSLIQDGFQIYHHTFFFTRDGAWTVIQQGMNEKLVKARRYHWHSENISAEGGSASGRKDLICEPHTGISSEAIIQQPLNLTANESDTTRQISVNLVRDSFNTLMNDIRLLNKHATPLSQMIEVGIEERKQEKVIKFLNLEDREFKTHPVVLEDFKNNRYLEKILRKINSFQPKNYEEVLAIEGVGPKTVRALALVSEIVYGAKPSYEDPARYSFAHGGKDATPYPVDRSTYDHTIRIMESAIRQSQLASKEKDAVLKRIELIQTRNT